MQSSKVMPIGAIASFEDFLGAPLPPYYMLLVKKKKKYIKKTFFEMTMFVQQMKNKSYSVVIN